MCKRGDIATQTLIQRRPDSFGGSFRRNRCTEVDDNHTSHGSTTRWQRFYHDTAIAEVIMVNPPAQHSEGATRHSDDRMILDLPKAHCACPEKKPIPGIVSLAEEKGRQNRHGEAALGLTWKDPWSFEDHMQFRRTLIGKARWGTGRDVRRDPAEESCSLTRKLLPGVRDQDLHALVGFHTMVLIHVPVGACADKPPRPAPLGTARRWRQCLATNIPLLTRTPGYNKCISISLTNQ